MMGYDDYGMPCIEAENFDQLCITFILEKLLVSFVDSMYIRLQPGHFNLFVFSMVWLFMYSTIDNFQIFSLSFFCLLWIETFDIDKYLLQV